MNLQHRQLCILVAEVAGSSLLYEKLGDTQARRVVEHCLEWAAQAALLHGGRVLKTLGHESLLTFDTAGQGIQAACAMQRQVAGLAPVSGVRPGIRIGLHYGGVLEEGGELFGDGMNTTARLAGLAQAHQIIASADTLVALAQTDRDRAGHLKPVVLKGKREPMMVAEVAWQDEEAPDMEADPFPSTEALGLRLRLRHGGRQNLFIDARRPSLSLGRGDGNDLVIRDTRASRTHAHIEFRGTCFVLTDQSSNGTHVVPEGQASFVVKREEAILRGRGRLSFGHPWAEGQSEFVDYLVLD